MQLAVTHMRQSIGAEHLETGILYKRAEAETQCRMHTGLVAPTLL